MKKEILITIFFTNLLIVTPFSIVARENTISNNLSEQTDVEKLVFQIRTTVNEILQNYGHIPVVKGLCKMILNLIWYPGKMLKCTSFIIYIQFIGIILCLAFVSEAFFELCFYQLWALQIYFAILYIESGCFPIGLFIFLGWVPDEWPWGLYKSIYIMLETKDITNLAIDCTCLQELIEYTVEHPTFSLYLL